MMARVANNADDYAAARIGVFFTASTNNTNENGDLTGQCVTLNKWFMAEMSSVPSPFSARGHARYVGHTLVNQGLAVEVAYATRKRGDIVTWEFGEYGHIGVLLSGDRVFQQNVGFAGTPSKIVYGSRVFASRIDPLYQSWQPVGPTFYRLNSYKEGDKEPMTNPIIVRILSALIMGNNGRAGTKDALSGQLDQDPDFKKWVGNETNAVIQQMFETPQAKAYKDYIYNQAYSGDKQAAATLEQVRALVGKK